MSLKFPSIAPSENHSLIERIWLLIKQEQKNGDTHPFDRRLLASKFNKAAWLFFSLLRSTPSRSFLLQHSPTRDGWHQYETHKVEWKKNRHHGRYHCNPQQEDQFDRHVLSALHAGQHNQGWHFCGCQATPLPHDGQFWIMCFFVRLSQCVLLHCVPFGGFFFRFQSWTATSLSSQPITLRGDLHPGEMWRCC